MVLLTVALAVASSDAVAQDYIEGKFDPAPPLNGVGKSIWTVRAVHSVHLPTGKLLVWKRNKHWEWDVDVQDLFEVTLVDPRDWFCGGHAALADGSVLVVGGSIAEGAGQDGAHETTIYLTGWNTNVTSMIKDRWYPTATTLADGRILVIGGSDIPNPDSCMDDPPVCPPLVFTEKDPEIFDPYVDDAMGTTGTWSLLGAEANRNTGVYPNMFLDPNGDVFYAGSQGKINQSFPATLDVDTPSWTPVGVGPYVITLKASAVMYYGENGEGTVLKSGGIDGPHFDPDNPLDPYGDVIDTVLSINLSDASPVWQTEIPLIDVRKNHNLVVLPTGQILALGGDDSIEQDADVADAVVQTEWFDPELPLDGWLPLADGISKRAYHATAVLLPDATVLNAGEDDVSKSADIYSPPYLFVESGEVPRPIIGVAPSIVMHGQTFSVILDAGSPVGFDEIDEVNLLRLAAATHSFDQNARFVSLGVVEDPVLSLLDVTAPSNENVLPRGYYMLFLVSDDGLPSDAEYVQVTCKGDLDGDGVVGIVDFLALLAGWGSNPGHPADYDGDGIVGIVDFLVVLGSWGGCGIVPDPGTIEEAVEDSGLSQGEWEDAVEDLQNPGISQAVKDNLVCWWEHYLECHPKPWCFECACVICPDVDPYGNHWEP